MIVLGLHGPYGAGKDTAFEEIQRWASERGVLAVRRGFADLLKLSAARIFQPDITLEAALEWANGFKFDGLVGSYRRYVEDHPEVEGGAHEMFCEPEFSLTGRELLQRYGTECHREVFGDNFWVDQLLPRDELARIRAICKFLPDNRLPQICCITDLRFENEATRIHEIPYGMVWRIDPGNRLPQTDAHISEKPLPARMIDQVVQNDTGVPDFHDRLRTMCDFHLADLIRTQPRQMFTQGA